MSPVESKLTVTNNTRFMTDPSQTRLPNRLSAATTQLIETRPFLVWMSGLTLMLVVAAIAGTGLLSPGPVEEEAEIAEVVPSTSGEGATSRVPSPSTTATPSFSSSSSDRPSQPDLELPFWFFGLLALGCMGGTWLIAQYLLRSNQQEPQAKRQPRRTPPPSSRPVERPVQPSSIVEPRVTVMSAAESHPLDGTEDLAEAMDIRKRKPLANVLRGY